MYVMPDYFKESTRSLSEEMSGALGKAIGLLRWRGRVVGPYRNAGGGLEWSLDADEWRGLPADTRLSVGEVARLEVSSQAADGLRALYESDREEPLAHVLFREAWEQRFASPRSSMLVGMTALEVAIKEYISLCTPGARWLAETAQLPPVNRLLREFLPSLPPPDGGSGFAMPPDEHLRTLGNAVTVRNQLAHVGRPVPEHVLLPTLRAVRNVMWSLDAAAGLTWAGAYVLDDLERDPSVGYRRL